MGGDRRSPLFLGGMKPIPLRIGFRILNPRAHKDLSQRMAQSNPGLFDRIREELARLGIDLEGLRCENLTPDCTKAVCIVPSYSSGNLIRGGMVS